MNEEGTQGQASVEPKLHASHPANWERRLEATAKTGKRGQRSRGESSGADRSRAGRSREPEYRGPHGQNGVRQQKE